MKLAIGFLLVACSAKSQPTTGSAGSNANPAPTVDASAVAPVTPDAAQRPYTGPPERGPCSDVHACKLRNLCGCSCEAVILSVPSNVDCDKSCPGNACDKFSLICDLSTQTCGAIPKAP